MEPLGTCRVPPTAVTSQLQHLNETLQLGNQFCRSRNPDFLLDLIQKNSQPMPWLSELVSEGSFEILPVQCLCEFLLGQTHRMMKNVLMESVKVIKDSALVVEKSSKKLKLSIMEPTSKEDLRSLQLLQYLQVCKLF